MKKNFKLIPEINYFNIDPLKFRGRGFFKKIKKDKISYLKKFSYLTSKKNFNCPLCKNKHTRSFLKISKNYNILECRNCLVKFPNVDFIKNKKYAEIIYAQYSKLNHRKNMDKTKNYRFKMMTEKYNFCILENFQKSKKIKVLDYGCGNGLFLQFLKTKGINCAGLEVDEASVQKLVKKKIKFYKDIEQIEDNSLDLCVLFDVLEHLTNPINDLKKIRKKLKKNGKIVMYTPNINSLSFELMGPNQNQVYPFQHTLFFGLKSINYLAKKTKLKIISNATYGLDIMDYFFMKEHLDKKKYFEKFRQFINKTQAMVDMTGYGNHFRIILQK